MNDIEHRKIVNRILGYKSCYVCGSRGWNAGKRGGC